MRFNEACDKLGSDINWLAARWLPIKHAFDCDATNTLEGDIDLERAYRRVNELKEHIERIRAARTSTIKKAVA